MANVTSTLHIRCGSDIRDGLAEAGVEGDFLEFSDPVCQGATPEGDEETFHAARMDYIANDLGMSRQDNDTRLREQREGLARVGAYDRLVLWFEHDIYDQATLIRLLAWLADRPDLHDRLFMIAVNGFPGIERFIGLGQLSPDQLKTLWGTEQPVTAEQLALGQRAWQAFRRPTPEAVAELIAGDTSALPLLAPALRRHQQELPWTTDGLSLTQRLTLQAVSQGASTPAKCFGELASRLEPQPFLGDLMYWPIVMGLATAGRPAMSKPEDWRSEVALLPFGEDLLAGRADWIAVNGIDRWLGGTHLTPGNLWRWDPEAERPVAAPT